MNSKSHSRSWLKVDFLTTGIAQQQKYFLLAIQEFLDFIYQRNGASESGYSKVCPTARRLRLESSIQAPHRFSTVAAFFLILTRLKSVIGSRVNPVFTRPHHGFLQLKQVNWSDLVGYARQKLHLHNQGSTAVAVGPCV